MIITRESLDNIKKHANIIDVINHYLPEDNQLTIAGSSQECLCPFHEESDPSFKVSEINQMFKCFAGGCDANEGGDVIDFVRKIRGITFQEAVIEIAEISGVKHLVEIKNTENAEKQNSLYKINEQLIKISQETISSYGINGKETIKELLNTRQIKEDIIEEFKIGYMDYKIESEFIKYLHNNPELIEKAEEIGLINKNEKGGIYTPFKNRILIPIEDKYKRIIGFAGRKDPNSKEGKHPKYINSKTSKMYNKGEVLYGLSKANIHIKKKREIYIAEGYMDALSLHQAGIKNAVAIGAANLTKSHVERTLKEYSNCTINLCPDFDKPGIEATKRNIELLVENEKYNCFVIDINIDKNLKQYKDINEILSSEDYTRIEDLKDKEKSKQYKIQAIEWYINEIKKEHPVYNSIPEKEAIAKEVRIFANKIKDNMVRQETYEYANKIFGFETKQILSREEKSNMIKEIIKQTTLESYREIKNKSKIINKGAGFEELKTFNQINIKKQTEALLNEMEQGINFDQTERAKILKQQIQKEKLKNQELELKLRNKEIEEWERAQKPKENETALIEKIKELEAQLKNKEKELEKEKKKNEQKTPHNQKDEIKEKINKLELELEEETLIYKRTASPKQKKISTNKIVAITRELENIKNPEADIAKRERAIMKNIEKIFSNTNANITRTANRYNQRQT